nr:CWF19-like protein 2 isoform X1 [Rhipicephalus microplus]
MDSFARGKKKKQKQKHKKRSSKAKKVSSVSDSSSSSGSSDEWAEAPPKARSTEQQDRKADNTSKAAQAQRDAWMNFEDVIPTISAKDHRAQRRGERAGGSGQREKTLRTVYEPGQHERELNPYWKEGGIGLPKEDEAKSAGPTLVASAVGDGGLRWLKRAYQRIREQAADEGRPLEEVAAERYGSLEKLESMIAEAESRASSTGDRHHGRHGTSRRYGRMQRPGSDDDTRSSRNKAMQRPGSDEERERPSRYKAMRRPGSDEETGKPSRHKAVQRPGSDEEREKPLRHRAMQRPGSDEEMERPSHHREKHRDSQSSGSKKWSEERGRFQRPGDNDDNSDQDDHRGKHRHRREHSSSSSSSKPSWMKKEFYKDTKDRQHEQKQDISKKGRDCLQEECQPPRQQGSPRSHEQPERENEPDPVAQREERAAPKLLSDKELNALGAKLIKAEMLGNTALYEKLKNEIEEARKARESAGASTCPDGAQRGSREEVVILTKTDGRGFAHPLSEPSEVGGPSRKKAKVPTHDRGGERVRYFADDDRHSLKNLFEREKMTTAEDQNAEFARLAGKVRTSKSQDYDFDDAVMDKASQHDSSAKQDARDRMKAIQEHKHMSKALEKCRYCIDSREMKKHLIIAIGIRAYLCLPPYQSLTEGHCLIVPQAHVACGTLLDEDVWLEVQVFRKGLTKMFEEMGKDTVFMETAVAFRHHPHAVIECIPVPLDVGNLAPMYFKKAIMECEREWAQNKKLVDLSKKGLRNSIPRGLPYFSVDFGLQGGFAHVIEDEKDFPVYFGKEVVGGMLDSEPRLWLKQQHESFDEQKKKVLEFAKWWEPYDWTERLKTESS